MITSIINKLTILPRWIIIVIDLVIIFFSGLLSYLIRFNFNWNEAGSFKPFLGLSVILISSLTSIMITQSYKGIVRYTSIDDGIRLLKTSFINVIILGLLNLLYYYNTSKNFIPYSVIAISFFVSFLFLFYYRLLVKDIFAFYKAETGNRIQTMIFGAGRSGLITKQVLDSNPKSNVKIVGFIDDDEHKHGKNLNGVPIYPGNTNLAQLFSENKIKELIISIRDISIERKNEIVEECLKSHTRVRSVPPVEKWVNGELKLQQIKEVKIDDLLGRESIVLKNESLLHSLQGKVVCITGAAGSIGGELVRQVVAYSPSKLILIDQSETPLYEIEREHKESTRDTRLLVFIADICNKQRMEYIFKEFKPEIVFHAAAYKHVPMMEGNPSEAVMCNVIGTRILADLSVAHAVKKFVMISTDKAVNPTSVMGCTKRIAEIYVQSLNNKLHMIGGTGTSFVTTRFGNVLGSNGSVIPLFKKQIDAGGPVTVTHPEITRYFMTIPEACQLVLEASVMGKGGEIFIFDMGKPIRIYDLAKKMIMLSNLKPDKDIDIVFTGLREGEKLFEELLNTKENTLPTHNEKILKAQVAEYPYEELNNFIDLLEELMNDKNELKMVALMKEIVPEFRSNYSRFEVLDN